MVVTTAVSWPYETNIFHPCFFNKPDKGVLGTEPAFSVPVQCGCRTEHTEVPGTGVYVAPNSPKYPAPVLMWYRTYRIVWYRY